MPIARQVILFLIDGLRPDALDQAEVPAIRRLEIGGATCRTAQTVSPEISLPCITSLFYSTPPQQHGILDNDWRPPKTSAPGLFEVIKSGGLASISVYNWETLRELSRPESLDFSYYHCHGNFETDGRELELAAVTVDYLVRDRPAFAFLYLELPDLAGHKYGWMSDEYMDAVTRADRAVELVLDELGAATMLDETVFLLTADHGGHENHHGNATAGSSDHVQDLTIPWILSGSGIRAGELACPVSLLDTAPTITRLLGLPAPSGWQGRVVEEALVEVAG
jgi:predicted AlkP superfamily pyrophosphatase or phosphodiesterase